MRKTAIFIISLVFVALLSLRFFQLSADPPIMLAQYGQSALTDPYLYTWHARQATLFPPDQQIEYERFAPLKFTAVSAAARVVFTIAGVSRVTANIASILLCLLGILFWLLALRKFWSWGRVAMVGLLMLSNFVLLTYSRMPYLENGLIFFFGLTLFIYAHWGERVSGQILTGFAIAGAALCGKLFGVLLFLPVFATQMYFLRTRSIKAIGLTILGGLIGFAAYLFLFLGGDFQLLWKYHTDTTELLHISKYFAQPLGPLGMFVSFGGEGGLTLFAIGSICLAAVGSIFWLISRDLGKLNRNDLPFIFSITWLAVTMVVFVPFEYRPLRYFIVGVIPAITLAIPLIESWGRRLPIIARPLWLVVPSVFVIMLLLTNQIISYCANLDHVFIGFKTVLPYCLGSACIVAILIAISRWRQLANIPLTIGRLLIVIFVGGYVVTNAMDIYAALSEPRYDLKKLNREVAEIIDPSALVTGSYAPALTIDNKLNGVFNYLGTVRHDATFFGLFKPTHILSNSGDWSETVKNYPTLRSYNSIISPIIWSYTLAIAPLPASNYSPSVFERTLQSDRSQDYITARTLLDAFIKRYPNNRLAQVTRINLYFSRFNQIDSTIALVDQLVLRYPEDYYILAFAASAYLNMNMPQQSRECLDRCNRMNPFVKPRLHAVSATDFKQKAHCGAVGYQNL